MSVRPNGVVPHPDLPERTSTAQPSPHSRTHEALARAQAKESYEGPTEHESDLHKRIAELETLVSMLQVAVPLGDIRKSVNDRAEIWRRKWQHDALLAGPSKDRTSACISMSDSELVSFAPKLNKSQIGKLSVPARDRVLAALPILNRAHMVFQLIDIEKIAVVGITDLGEDAPQARYVLKSTAPESTEDLIVSEVPDKTSRAVAEKEWVRQHRISGGQHALPSL